MSRHHVDCFVLVTQHFLRSHRVENYTDFITLLTERYARCLLKNEILIFLIFFLMLIFYPIDLIALCNEYCQNTMKDIQVNSTEP